MNARDEKIPLWVWAIPVVIAIIIVVVAIWFLPKSKPSAARVEIPVYRQYDFSDVAVPGEVYVLFRSDSVTEVTLPPAAVVFRTDPSSDIEIIFIDGSRYVDGPGRRVWYGLKKGIFKTQGLKEAGILKITLEKKI